MKEKLLAGLIFIFLLSCEDTAIEAHEFTVVVERQADLACGLPVIRFIDHLDQVRERTSLNASSYNAYHLDNGLNNVGATLIIEFTKVAPQDLRVCNTMGLPFPGISIVNARLAD